MMEVFLALLVSVLLAHTAFWLGSLGPGSLSGEAERAEEWRMTGGCVD